MIQMRDIFVFGSAILIWIAPNGASGAEHKLTRLSCDFEDNSAELCDWLPSNASYTWNTHIGPTDDFTSGPAFDHTFQDSTGSNGHYAYAAGWQGGRNRTATLTSALVTLSVSATLTFWYQMNGQGVGSLSLVSVLGPQPSDLWRKTGRQGANWRSATIDLRPGPQQLAFVTTARLPYGSDIAVDDIALSTEEQEVRTTPTPTTSPPTTTPTPTTPPPPLSEICGLANPGDTLSAGGCDFEKGECGYRSVGVEGSKLLWKRQSGIYESYLQSSQILGDHGTGNGFYVVLDTKHHFLSQGIKARYISPELQHTGVVCVEFAYISPTFQSAEFTLKIETDGVATLLVDPPDESITKWTLVNISTCVQPSSKLIFEGVRTSLTSYVAIDDIRITSGECGKNYSSLTSHSLVGTTPTTRLAGTSQAQTVRPSSPPATSLKTSPKASSTHVTAEKSTITPSRKPQPSTDATTNIRSSTLITTSVATTQPTASSSVRISSSSTTQASTHKSSTSTSTTMTMSFLSTVAKSSASLSTVTTPPTTASTVGTTSGSDIIWSCDFLEPCTSQLLQKPQPPDSPLRWTWTHDTSEPSGAAVFSPGETGRSGDSVAITTKPLLNIGPKCLTFTFATTQGQGQYLGVFVEQGVQQSTDERNLVWHETHASQGKWVKAEVNFVTEESFRLAFLVVKSAGSSASVKLRDVILRAGECSGSGQPRLDQTCDFDHDLCGYRQLTKDDFDWRIATGKGGPAFDHTTGSGRYLYVESSPLVQQPHRARLVSAPIPSHQYVCLLLSYTLTGNALTALNVYVTPVNASLPAYPQWSTKRSIALWDQLELNIDMAQQFQIVIEGEVTSCSNCSVAIDDLNLSTEPCKESPTCRSSSPCENGGTCVDGPEASFQCWCPRPYSGPRCAEAIASSQVPVHNTSAGPSLQSELTQMPPAATTHQVLASSGHPSVPTSSPSQPTSSASSPALPRNVTSPFHVTATQSNHVTATSEAHVTAASREQVIVTQGHGSLTTSSFGSGLPGNNEALGMSAKVGIGLGCVLAGLVVVALGVFLCKYKTKAKRIPLDDSGVAMATCTQYKNID